MVPLCLAGRRGRPAEQCFLRDRKQSWEVSVAVGLSVVKHSKGAGSWASLKFPKEKNISNTESNSW